MLNYLKKDRWSPYFVGASIGLLLTFLFTIGKQIGASSGIARLGALLEYAGSPSHVEKSPYFSHLLGDSLLVNWKLLFLIGMLGGAWIASKLTSDPIPSKNTIWEHTFGPSKFKRHTAAFIGGTLLMIGARIANGCTSGHAISGGAQLSLTSWLFMCALFATAIPTAFLLYNKRSAT